MYFYFQKQTDTSCKGNVMDKVYGNTSQSDSEGKAWKQNAKDGTITGNKEAQMRGQHERL